MRFSDLGKKEDQRRAAASPPKKEPAPVRAPEPLSAAKPGKTQGTEEVQPATQGPISKGSPPKPGESAARRPLIAPPAAGGGVRSREGVESPARPREASAKPRKLAERAPETPFRQLDEEAREIYSRLIAAAREFIIQADQPYTEKYEKITRLCASSAEALKKNPVLLNCASYATADNYLYAHTVNVTIFSQAIALELALPPDDTSLLSFCAMSHDLGMSGFQELYSKEERLSDSEFSRITLHTGAGAAKLDRVLDIDYSVKERAKKIIHQTHERIDASGYPDRLSNEEIDLLAQIIGLADVYEAMTHPRSWREARQPHEVIKQLIEKEDTGFSSKTVKALISALSIYPPGSLAALSSGAIARVLKPRKGSLTRPLVEIFLDADFVPVQSRVLDLFEYPLTAIARPVDPAELEEKNPKVAARLELARWWVEW